MEAGISESAASILLVDDEPHNLDALEALLDAPGHRLVRAVSAEAALAALLDDDFAVILLDIQMPGMNGLELAEAIKQRKRTREVPIVFLTAHYQDDDDRLRGYGVGAVDYLTKPINERILRSKVAVYVELFRKTRELQRVSEYKTMFLSAMSHELRTPLNSIIGFTGTLLMKLKGPLNESQEAQLRTVQGSARHLLSLINDLLDIARIEAGRAELHPERVACQDVIGEVAETLRPLAEQRGLTLAVDAPPAPVFAFVDRRALMQILLNVAGNAIKFTERGGVRLELRAWRADGAPQRTEIAVADTGPGIGAEDEGRLFEPFGRLGEPGSRRAEGSGLGLHLSRKLAALIGGQLSCVSRHGEGSRFTLTLGERTH